MRRRVACFLLCFSMWSLSSLHSQIIIKVIRGYVLVDTDTGIGRLNEVIKVYRLKDDGLITVCRVRILRFQDGKTGAQIISEEPGYKISVGDFVGEKRTDAKRAPKTSSRRSAETSEQNVPRRRGDARVGVHLGRFVPASNLEDVFENSYSLGLSLKLLAAGRHTFTLDGTCPVLRTASVGSGDVESSLYMVHLVDHIRSGYRIHWDIGGGIYYSRWSATVNRQTIKSTDSYTGFFVGFSVDFGGSSWGTFSPMVRYHAYKAEEDWYEFVIGGVNVYFSVF